MPANPVKATPLRVGICVDFSDGWLGGLNYFKNLINAVNETLPGKLEFVVFTGTRVDEKLLATWPHGNVIRSSIFDRFSAGWFVRKLFQKYLLSDPTLLILLKKHRIDVLSHSGYVGKRSTIACVGWIPDFQHLHLKEVFRRWDIVRRDAEIARIVRASTSVIVSSFSARSDLLTITPQSQSKVEVLRFVGESGHRMPHCTKPELQHKYGFAGEFVYLPNQYWSHKNHLTVIRAVAALKKEGKLLTILSTGKNADFRQPGFFKSVEHEIEKLDVANEYRLLGVVPYEDVVSLMQHCMFAINPSLFEGWSTTVEEAKAIGKHIVLSDIPVHREQAPTSADFFEPLNKNQLQEILWRRWNQFKHEAPQAVASTGEAAEAQKHKRSEFAVKYFDIIERAYVRKGLK